MASTVLLSASGRAGRMLRLLASPQELGFKLRIPGWFMGKNWLFHRWLSEIPAQGKHGMSAEWESALAELPEEKWGRKQDPAHQSHPCLLHSIPRDK